MRGSGGYRAASVLDTARRRFATAISKPINSSEASRKAVFMDFTRHTNMPAFQTNRPDFR